MCIYVKSLGAANTVHGSKAGNYVVMEDWWHRGRKVENIVMIKKPAPKTNKNTLDDLLGVLTLFCAGAAA